MISKNPIEIINNILQSSKGKIVVLAIIASLIIPIIINDVYSIRIFTLIAIFSIYASSWNLLASSGQGSLGHSPFLGIGGFTSSLLAIYFGIPSIIGIIIGALVSAGIGFLIGLSCVRLEAWFLAMVTFGFFVITETLFLFFDDFTFATLGFRTPILVDSGLPFYYFAVFLSIITIGIIFECL